MEIAEKKVITLSKKELAKKLILLAKIVDLYSRVDKENKTLILQTALDEKEREVEPLIKINKEISDNDYEGWDEIQYHKPSELEFIIK